MLKVNSESTQEETLRTSAKIVQRENTATRKDWLNVKLVHKGNSVIKPEEHLRASAKNVRGENMVGRREGPSAISVLWGTFATVL